MLICDCTLRDGGYYTNWDFEKKTVIKYLKTMETIDSINIVELGYRSKKAKKYFGEYFYCPEYFLKEARELAPSKTLAIMLNEKDCTKNDLEYLLTPCLGTIDLIRLAVDPANFERALNLAVLIKDMGFKVAFNLMYMSEWTKDHLFITKLKLADGIVDLLYLVDSYGSMIPAETITSFDAVKKEVPLPLGFHGHNNLELGLINTIKAIEAGAKVVDCTITGMGRGAGNLKTELLLTYLNSKENQNIDLSHISDLVATFETLQQKYKWGTSLPYMISGAYSLPQAEVMSWMMKHRYTIHSIVMALQNKKDQVEDNLRLKTFVTQKSYDEAIIIGGGNTSLSVKDAIQKYTESKNICLILAGGRFAEAYNEIKIDQFCCLVGAEGIKIENVSNIIETFIVPPHPRPMGTIIPTVREITLIQKKNPDNFRI